MRTGAWRKIEGVVLYRVVELEFSFRHALECLRGGKPVRIEGYPPLYVSKADYAKLWPESPHAMLEKGYAIKAELRVKPLLFGGLSRAEVVSTEILHVEPCVSK
ncbi:MAG: hypothetical protein JXR29_14010 [Methylothermaceae bacterium]|nr:hypothetical protein [Methylothermaceae bacterium]